MPRKPSYKKQGDSAAQIYFHMLERKWTLGEEIADVTFQHDDAASSSPPLGQWSTSSGDLGPMVFVIPHLLKVEGASEDSNGIYVRCENLNDRPLFRLAGDEGTLKFNGTEWAIHKRGENAVAKCQKRDHAPPLADWSGGANVSVFESPFPEAPRFMWVHGSGEQIVNGCYACTHSRGDKPRYVRVGGEGSIFVDDGVWKIGKFSFQIWWLYQSHAPAADHAVPPTTGWRCEPGDEPEPQLQPMQKYSESPPSSAPSASSTSPPFLVVRGAGRSDLNGRYAKVGTHSDAPKYRQLGGTAIIFYQSGMWRMNHEENTNQRRYDGPADRTVLPLDGWSDFTGRYAPSPTVSFGSHSDLQAGDSVRLVKREDEVDWSHCPQSDRFTWVLPGTSRRIDRIEGEWFFNTDFPNKIVPLAALGEVAFNDEWHVISEVSHTSAESPSEPPFIVVRGAGDPRHNGRYAKVGTHSDEPKYQKLGGSAIMFYESDLWRLFHEDDTSRRFYDGPSARTPLPTSGWRAINERADGVQCAPAPTVSFGSYHDLQAGDKVYIAKTSTEADWSGCPQSDHLYFSEFARTWTVHQVQGDWWFPEEFPHKIAPLSALGFVKFNDQRHSIAAQRTLSSSASAPARAFAASTAASSGQASPQPEQVEEDGFDEEWCPDQDVERFRCCICMSVARNAMVHECGAVLFCEMCWVKCQQDSDNCPVCKQDGSSMVPAHGDRRLIRNLMIMCPNKCGERIPLCEKDWLVDLVEMAMLLETPYLLKSGCADILGIFPVPMYCVDFQQRHLGQRPPWQICFSTSVSFQQLYRYTYSRTSVFVYTASQPKIWQDKHIKDSCQNRQVTCSACDLRYDANAEEEHQKDCPARLVPCRICGEEVRKCDMEDHFGNSRSCWIARAHLTVELLDKVASLEAEVKRLKGEGEWDVDRRRKLISKLFLGVALHGSKKWDHTTLGDE